MFNYIPSFKLDCMFVYWLTRLPRLLFYFHEIVLALNRILKDRTNTQNQNLKLIARKLLKRTESLLALHFPKIQRKINGYEKDYYISIKGNNQGTNWQLKIFDLIQI